MEDNRPYAGYGRVSSDDQRDAETIKNQITEVTRYADAHGISIGEWYLDDGITGTVPLDERPEGTRLLTDARQGKWRGLICLNHKRIGRDAFVIHLAVRQLERELGLDILAVREPVPKEMNPGARSLMRAVYAGVAEHDREDFLANSREGMERAAREGRWCGGRPPFGYQLEPIRIKEFGFIKGSRLIIHEEQAEIVREIFSLYASGMRLRGLVRHLNSRAIPHPMAWYNPSKERPWYEGTVSRILHNPAYIGNWSWRKTVGGKYAVPGSRKTNKDRQISHPIPSIISEELFNQVQSLLKENFRLSPRNAKKHYLLRGLVKCGLCGHTYVGLSGGSPKYQQRYYRCGSHVRSMYLTPCGNKALRADRIEETVWEHCRRFICTPGSILDELHQTLNLQKKRQSNADAERKRIESLLVGKASERERVITLHRRGSITSEDVERQLEALNREVKELEQEREVILEREKAQEDAEARLLTIEAMLVQLSEQIDSVTEEMRREIVLSLVDAITVTKDKDDIRGKKPPQVQIRFSFSPQRDVNYVEHGGPPESAKTPASSGVLFVLVLRSSARSRVESGSSETPPRVKIRASGERELLGKDSISSVITVPPTTVRVVSTAGASASLIKTSSAVTRAGFKVKPNCTFCPATVIRPRFSSTANPFDEARIVYIPGSSSISR